VTPEERAAAVERLEAAAKVAEAVVVVLRLAITDLNTNPDPQQSANVLRFATRFAIRQTGAIFTHLTGCP
jgi:hypothetical protein